eukprot:1143-Heterococcus_DN1.PRE.1
MSLSPPLLGVSHTFISYADNSDDISHADVSCAVTLSMASSVTLGASSAEHGSMTSHTCLST